MGLFDWLSRKDKPLSKMTRQELRRQELLLEKERDRLRGRVEKIAARKQGLFEQGAKERIPEIRRTLAQEFELLTSEQLMIGRQLNMRTKEAMTVARMRMLRENADRAREHGDRLGRISEKDMLRLGRMIESDAITAEMYQQRLDEVLAIGAGIDQGEGAIGDAGRAVMNVWEQMDGGLIADEAEAYDEADRRVREQQTHPPEA